MKPQTTDMYIYIYMIIPKTSFYWATFLPAEWCHVSLARSHFGRSPYQLRFAEDLFFQKGPKIFPKMVMKSTTQHLETQGSLYYQPKLHALWFSGNPSRLPDICNQVWFPQNGSHLMIPETWESKGPHTPNECQFPPENKGSLNTGMSMVLSINGL